MTPEQAKEAARLLGRRGGLRRTKRKIAAVTANIQAYHQRRAAQKAQLVLPLGKAGRGKA